MNTLLERLGFLPTDRVVIFHAADVGMTQASVQAAADLWACGALSSIGVMVPGPWFPGAADLCRRTAGIDVGVHVTLHAPFESCRWSPLSTQDPASGLLDADGYLPRHRAEVLARASADAVGLEIRAQVSRAVGAGLALTHLDAQSLTAAFPPFATAYVTAALRAGLPAMFPSPRLAAELEPLYGRTVAAETAAFADQLEAEGVPVADAYEAMPLNEPRSQFAYLKYRLKRLRPGLTHFALFPARDTPELRALCPDWACRVANYVAFLNPDLATVVRDAGIHVIGYLALRELLRRTPRA